MVIHMDKDTSNTAGMRPRHLHMSFTEAFLERFKQLEERNKFLESEVLKLQDQLANITKG